MSHSSSSSFRAAQNPEDAEGGPDEIWLEDPGCDYECSHEPPLYDAACPIHGARAMIEALENVEAAPAAPAPARTTVVHVKEPYDVYIGRAVRRRGFEGSIWANPYPLAMGTREQVIAAYREHLLASPELLAALPKLRGKRLGCWCKPLACHGDVLAELADATVGGT